MKSSHCTPTKQQEIPWKKKIKRKTDTPKRPVNIEYQERKAELHRRRKEKWNI